MSLKKSNGQILLSEACVLRCEACFSPYTLCWTFHLSLKFLFLPDRINHQLWWKKNKGRRGKQKELQYFIKNVKYLRYVSKNYRSCNFGSVRTRDVIYLVIFVTHQHLEKWIIPQVIFFSRTSWVSKSANATWAADWLNPACKHFIYIHSCQTHKCEKHPQIQHASLNHFLICLVRQSRWCQINLLPFIWPSRAEEKWIYLIYAHCSLCFNLIYSLCSPKVQTDFKITNILRWW